MNETTRTFDQLQEQHHAVSRDWLARAIWSTIIEPGDQDAGELIASLNAVDALEAVLAGESDSIDEEKFRSLRERALPKFSSGAMEMAFRSAARCGAELVTPEHPHWPTRMNDLGHSAPGALWVRGNTEHLIDEVSTAIGGARGRNRSTPGCGSRPGHARGICGMPSPHPRIRCDCRHQR